ncbi:hypothetical protein HDE_11059 [Halotydeus destructor]|nr:hypothetical protein HDE_11059 [Halotydeus destructor]
MGDPALVLRIVAALVMYVRMLVGLGSYRKLFKSIRDSLDHLTISKLSRMAALWVTYLAILVVSMLTITCFNVERAGVIQAHATSKLWTKFWVSLYFNPWFHFAITYLTNWLFYAAILLFVLCQASLTMLAKQAIECASSPLKIDPTAITKIRLEHEKLLAFHKMAAETLGMIPTVLSAFLFLASSVQICDYLNRLDFYSTAGNFYFLLAVIDLLVLFVMLRWMAKMAAEANHKLQEYQAVVMTYGQPGSDDECPHLAISKLSLLIDLSNNEVTPMRILNCLDFNQSFSVSFLCSLVPFTWMVLQPVVRKFKNETSNSTTQW